MIRRAILRWLGVPSRAEVRDQVLREIDADAVWRDGLHTGAFGRADKRAKRGAAILLGQREDTRV